MQTVATLPHLTRLLVDGSGMIQYAGYVPQKIIDMVQEMRESPDAGDNMAEYSLQRLLEVSPVYRPEFDVVVSATGALPMSPDEFYEATHFTFEGPARNRVARTLHAPRHIDTLNLRISQV
jgi:hypothetical protein